MRSRRFPRPITVIAAAGVAAGVLLAPATDAAPLNKTFEASLAPSDATLSATATSVTYTLKNTARGPQSFASANVTVPSGVTATCPAPCDVSGSGAAGFTATVSGQVIELRSDPGAGVDPTETITVSLSVAVTGDVCDTTWPAQVKQSNDFSGLPGNDFVPDPNPETGYSYPPSLPVQGGTHLEFADAGQPTDMQYSTDADPRSQTVTVDGKARPIK